MGMEINKRHNSINKMNQTQDDFSSLQAVGGHHIKSEQLLVDLCKISGRHGEAKKTCLDETYSVECFNAEVHAMLAAWEECEATQKKFEQAEHTSMILRSTYGHELRRLSTFAPPKRFHMTVWRSLTRRLVAHSRKSIEAEF
jgi:hypothetical protein